MLLPAMISAAQDAARVYRDGNEALKAQLLPVMISAYQDVLLYAPQLILTRSDPRASPGHLPANRTPPPDP